MDNVKLPFKYTAEAMVHVFAETNIIFALDDLKKFDKNISCLNEFNIYAILSRPQYYFDNTSLRVTSRGIKFNIFDDNKNIVEKNVEYIFQIAFCEIELDDYVYKFAELSCEYPFNRVSITLEQCDDLVKYLSEKTKHLTTERESVIDAILGNKYLVDIEEVLLKVYEARGMEYWFEVLYVGQSQGKKVKSNAFERLQSPHEALQKILIDCHTTYKNRRIFIMAFNFVEKLMIVTGCVKSDKLTVTEEDDKEHTLKLIRDFSEAANDSTLDKKRQILNLTEAAMIHYFKPLYNTNYVNNFPSMKHGGYKHYYDLEYNTISISLGLMNSPPVALYTEENRATSKFDAIQYELFHNDRASFQDVFCHIAKRS